jgi:hypothetical protein
VALVLIAVGIRVAPPTRRGFVRQPKASQRDPGEADAEFLQRPAPRDGLGHTLGQFIEFLLHNFPFGSCWFLVCSFAFYVLLPEIGFQITNVLEPK